jgi:D-serine deaminase-like pyridoxal phosphate-dependent protein
MTNESQRDIGPGLPVGQRTALPERLAAAVTGLRNRPIAATDKGFGRHGAVTAAALAQQRPALFGGGFDTPVLVLREAALRQNIEAMAAYCTAAGVLHAPHGKTTMAPQLIARQLTAGAWAVTAATIAQAQVYRAFGVPRVLIANQITERGAAEWLARELAADPAFDCYAYADSMAGVALLDEAAATARPGRPLKVLVELGYPGGRAGLPHDCRGAGRRRRGRVGRGARAGRRGGLRGRHPP